MSETLHLIQSAGAELGALAEKASDSRCVFSLLLSLSDGNSVPYRLEVADTGKGVTVKEVTPSNLPGFCPQRHINSDGTFCLTWRAVDGLQVGSVEDARRWWKTLWKFLTLQVLAGKMHRWPNNNAWAHGSAAFHQLKAQEAAARLGGCFPSALSSGEITVKWQRRHGLSLGHTLQVFVRNKRVYSVWLDSGKVVNKKQRCFCGLSGLKRPVRLRRCGDHAVAAAELALQMVLREKAEQSYWQGFQDKPCCGTCDACPLQKKTDKKDGECQVIPRNDSRVRNGSLSEPWDGLLPQKSRSRQFVPLIPQCSRVLERCSSQEAQSPLAQT